MPSSAKKDQNKLKTAKQHKAIINWNNPIMGEY